MNYAELLNGYFRDFWQELEIRKIQNLQTSVEGLDNSSLLAVLTGVSSFVDVDGGMDMVEDTPIESCSVSAINSAFEHEFQNLLSRIISYSHSMSESYNDVDLDDCIHFWGLLNSYFLKLVDLRAEYTEFSKITGVSTVDESKYINDIFSDSQLEDSQNEVKQLRTVVDESKEPEFYTTAVEKYLKELHFSHLYAVNSLSLAKNYTALQIMQITGSNGLELLPEHKKAQEVCERLRGADIFPENILNCIWNSGWLSPDGEFYGCSDLGHICFSDKLIIYLRDIGDLIIDPSIGDASRQLEVAGFLKFSTGRWLFLRDDVSPSKSQLEVIYDWAHNKAEARKICFGDSGQFIGLDVLQSKINSIKNV